MVVEKKEIIELQKHIERKINEMNLSPKPDSAKIFDLNMLDSNISLFLLGAEFRDGPLELLSKDKLIIDALRAFRNDSVKGMDISDMANDIALAAQEILELIDNLEDRVGNIQEKIFTDNVGENAVGHCQGGGGNRIQFTNHPRSRHAGEGTVHSLRGTSEISL